MIGIVQRREFNPCFSPKFNLEKSTSLDLLLASLRISDDYTADSREKARSEQNGAPWVLIDVFKDSYNIHIFLSCEEKQLFLLKTRISSLTLGLFTHKLTFKWVCESILVEVEFD